jgi:arginyl-tRNA synthetase
MEEKDKLPQQRALLLKMNEFWPTIQGVVANYNPASLCDYLSSMCRDFSSW